MTKQAISITLSPDNLVWLRGRSRADQAGSLSEFLDRLITQARFGGRPPTTPRSMKGSLVGLASEPPGRASAVSPDVWREWRARWDDLLTGIDTGGGPQPPAPRRTRRA